MATFSDLKERIATEMVRDDIASGGDKEGLLETHIQRACEFYADRKFWFNSLITTATTTPNTRGVTVPAGIRIIERVTIPSYNFELREIQLTQVPDFPVYALPDYYAYYNDTILLDPIPNTVYTLQIYGIAQIAAPTLPADTSVWTNEAQDLIIARVKKNLFRSVFRDADGAALAATEEQEEFDRMLRETSRRLETPARPKRMGSRYSIYSDR